LQNLPHGFQSSWSDCGEVRLHVVHNAAHTHPDGTLDDPRTPIVFLHGFPEYWAAWKPVMRTLATDFLLIAPDQRGYNLSDAPLRVSDYAAKKLVSDLLALSSNLLGNRRFVLAGHDWGASVAYAAAISVPERLLGLIIVNGVHPVLFQKALVENRAQAQASQYFHYLRADDAAERMSQDDFRRTFGMLEKFSATPWLDDEEREGYRKAWSQPGRLNAMLNWYRASPIVVPLDGEPLPPTPLKDGGPDRFGVAAPHLLVWGMQDVALLPVCRAGLERFAPQLSVVEIPDAGHWVIHTHGERVAQEIRTFVSGLKRP
jgi:pimeloyl-ACP methyl ester carboxylesterase